MEIKDLQGKLVAVLGFGLEGRAVYRYLIKHGVKFELFDQKPLAQWPVEDQNHIKALGAKFNFGPDCFEQLEGFDVAFRSPGVKLSQIKAKKLEITSQTKFFFENCPGKIIGVTGTKGKGTTCALIYEMLKESKVFLTGNIGKEQPLDFLDKLSRDYWVIYELSSFQLQDLHLSPRIGVVLMVTSEHLDYHENLKDYILAKEAIAKYQSKQDIIVINGDFKASMEIGSKGAGKKLLFSRKEYANADCFVKNGRIWLSRPGGKAKKNKILEICETSAVGLRGEHNLENICAAILVAVSAGAELIPIKRAIENFKGLEHRLEFAGEKAGIKFYNDSFSTIPEAAIAAIKAFHEPLVLILGGSSKNSNFAELGEVINSAENVKALILVGQEAGRIKQVITNQNILKLEGAQNMSEIFGQIKTVAKSGDVVLLSPACASFDMFESYKDRGEQFKKQIASS